ncbi:MAG: LysR family transcriptional regulator [Alphaproteobacteria bacterium]|nr:LysR family transcriptional regulator [Magnetovibrio sp.]|tara:strand:+ start:20372 stop:21283 length:912 start_codon:yes stop_codon:yes gene_type:complete
MDHLTGMAVFAKVVETGTFTGAAQAMGLSKGAVSKQIAKLEDRLGARLLNRTTRRSSLTEVGAAFYERCRRIVAEAEEAELAVTRLHAEPRGTLRVNLPMSFGMIHMADALPDFMAAYPEISLDVTLDDRVVNVVDEGYDVVIRITDLPDSSLIARRIAPFRIATCASSAYWDAHGRPKHPDDLRNHACLLYSYLSNLNEWRYRGPDGPFAVRVDGPMRGNNGDLLRAAAVAGLGVVRSPTFIVGCHLVEGRLEQVLAEYEDDDRGIYAVYPHNRHLSAKVRAFVDFMAKRFADPQWVCMNVT